MDADLFTFTAYEDSEARPRVPIFKHQGFPSYTPTTTFHCLCRESTIDVPHTAMAAPRFWRCRMQLCRRGYTFHLDLPPHVERADESIRDTLINIEDSIASLHGALQDTENAIILHQPIRDIAIRPQDAIAVLERVMRQPHDNELRNDVDMAFRHLEERFDDMQRVVGQTLEDITRSTEDAVRKAERTLRHVKGLETTTATAGDTLQGVQEELGGIANLRCLIQQFNPHEGLAQLQPTLMRIHRSLEQLLSVVANGDLTVTRDTVTEIQGMLGRYNRRYDKSIGVIIG